MVGGTPSTPASYSSGQASQWCTATDASHVEQKQDKEQGGVVGKITIIIEDDTVDTLTLYHSINEWLNDTPIPDHERWYVVPSDDE